MPPSEGRSGTACQHCRRQKVKCTGAIPCRNCYSSGRDCVYPIRDRNVTVSERYLRHLEAELNKHAKAPAAMLPPPPTMIVPAPIPNLEETLAAIDQNSSASMIGNSTSESFVSRLKELYKSRSTTISPDIQLSDHNGKSIKELSTSEDPLSYEYVHLSFDTTYSTCSFKLPPYPYATHLLDQFESYIAYEYHWFLRVNFRKKMYLTYHDKTCAESRDRVWLCRLLVVFALGETYTTTPTPEIYLSPDRSQEACLDHGDTTKTTTTPGTEFFEQALMLLKIPFEEPTIEHIEALNLIAFYSYSLNRRKTAYTYAGLSMRLSNIISLHKPCPVVSYSAVELEHRKRVWWTSYCLDKIISTEMDKSPDLTHDPMLSYPTIGFLSTEERKEFSEPEYLTAQVRLTFIKMDIVTTVLRLKLDDPADVQSTLQTKLKKLESWRMGLPPHMIFDLEHGIPQEVVQLNAMRSLVSLYLRFNQCIIMLLRPLFLKLIDQVLSIKPAQSANSDLSYFNDACLRAARDNLKLLIGLWQVGKVAIFGFWESLHLFSSITIMVLAMSVNTQRPGTFDGVHDDEITCRTAKYILLHMVQAGNLAAKDHTNMLQDVETVAETISTLYTRGPNTEVLDGQLNMDEWISQLFEHENLYEWNAETLY